MKKMLVFIISGSLFVASCKGKKGDEGIPGPTGQTGASSPTNESLSLPYLKEGFIKGNISGKTSDSIPYSINYNFEIAGYPNNYYEVSYWESSTTDDSINITVSKRLENTEEYEEGSCSLYLKVKSLNTLDKGYGFTRFSLTKKFNKNNYVSIGDFNRYCNVTYTNLNYDSTRYILSGSFVFSDSLYKQNGTFSTQLAHFSR